MAEIARAVTGQDPHDKYPKRDGRCYLVGKSELEVSDVLYRKLFRPNPKWNRVRDPIDGQWRAVRPWQQWDQDNRKLWKVVPPLIPKRFIEDIGWSDKKKQVPKVIRLTTGWEMWFFTSNGDPPQGVDIDLAYFDEEIIGKIWYPEVAARLLDRRGKFIWAATPQNATEEMLKLYDRSRDPKNSNRVQGFYLHIDKNPYIDKEMVEELKEKYRGDDYNWQVRIEGHFAILGMRVFNEFDIEKVHGCTPFAIPETWTLYAVIDPGSQVCAILFMAVPPPDDNEHRGHIYIFDEAYIRGCDATEFARTLRKKTENRQIFEDFIIDHQMGQQSDVGFGSTVETQYAEALNELGVICNRHGSGFSFGSNDPHGRVEHIKKSMRIRGNGTPELQVFRNTVPTLEWEVNRYSRKRRADGYVTDEFVERDDHLTDCLGMGIAYQPEYVKPKNAGKAQSPAYRAYMAEIKADKAEARREGRGSFVSLGPAH